MNPNAAMVCQHDTLSVVLSILMPHGHFCLWTPGRVWLHLLADGLIILAYFSIPIAFVYFVRNRKDITVAWMFACLGIFTLAGIATYLMETWNVRNSHYWLSGAIKALAALASVPTAILLARLARLVAALHASEERFRSYFELGLIGTAITSPTKGWVEINDEISRILGYERSELLRMSWAELTHPDDLAADVAHFNRVLAGETDGYAMDKRFIRKDGRVIDAAISVRCLRRSDGAVDYFVALVQDITERKQAEEALAAQVLRYKTLMETSTDSIYVMDEKGDLQEANAAFLRRRGYTAAEVKGLNVEDWDARYSREQLQERMSKLTGSSAVFETQHRCKDGSIFDVEVCATSVRIGGEQLLFVVTRDITERKQAEAAFAVRARQQALIGELGELALAGGELQSLFDQTVARVAETLGVEYCKVLELLPDGSAVKLVAGVGWKEGLVGRTTVALGSNSQAGYTLLTKNLIVVEDLRRETRFNGPPLLREHGVVSGLSVIIGEVEKPFGVLGAHSTRQRTFTADDMHFFQSVANTLAEAIQRKQAEDRLRRSEEKFKALFGIAPVGISVLDRQHNITDTNPALEQIMRLSREELLGGAYRRRSYLNADGTPRPLNEFPSEHAVTKGRPVNDEVGVVRENGEIIWTQVSVAPLALPEASAVVITQDITERKQAEQALRESEERFRELAENINEVFWAWTATPGNARCLYVSPAYATIWGRSCESLYSSPRSWMEALHPQDRERIMEEGARMDFEKISDWTYRIVRPDQSVRWIRDRIFPVRDEDGVVVRFAGIAEDITESRIAEAALRDSETRFRQIAENIEEMFWITDLEGSSTIYISPAYERITGRTCESLYAEPKSWRDDIHPEDRPRMEATFASDPGSTGDYTYRIVRPDCSIRWIRDRGFPVRDESGKLIRFAGIAEDITEHKIAEAALRDSEERFRELAENINEVFFVWDATEGASRLLYVSPAYATIWGRSCESLYSSHQSWKDALHPDDKKWVLAELSNSALEKINDLTYRIVRLDQSVRWIRDRIFPVYDENGVVVRLAEITEDITKNKQTAEAQERALSLMLATLESTADGILVVNTEGKIVTFNRLFARMWRLSEDVLASNEDARALDCVLDQLNEPENFLEKVRYLYEHSGEESFDRLVFKDGRVFERYSRPQFIGGRVAGRVWSFRDATQRAQAAKELEEANDQLRLLSRRRIQEQEDERRRLSRELHDQIGQSLTAAKINVEALPAAENPALVGRIDETIAILDQLLGQVRQISLDLRPPMLDDLGLVPALRSLVDEQGRRASVGVRFSAEHIPEKLDPEIQITCFRIAQEAITNAVRHAKATQLDIALRCTRGKELRLLARDDGIGFDARAKQAQAVDLGLIGIKERAALVGGRAKIISSPRKGTTVDVSLPLKFRGERQARHL